MKNAVGFFCCSALFFAVSTGLPAQDEDVFAHPLSGETLPRYTVICSGLAGRPYVKGAFEQRRSIPRLNRTLVSKGEFLIAAGQGMIWDTRSPFPSALAVGRDFIVQSVPGGTMTRLDAGGNELFMGIADTISSLFTGNAEKLREKFDNYFIETGSPDRRAWTLGLIPRDKSFRAIADRIVLSGDSGPVLIRSIVMYEQDGGGVAYTLSEHRFPPGLEADEQALFFIE